ncbi:MAG TPA: DMT family transporter [Burkholderiales bacterium]|nr:DMT family transporter [Burkholderiales bacterium]
MSARLGILVLAGIATLFGANHVAARYAIDHGASVAGAVATRSACTALVLLLLIKITNTKLFFVKKALPVGVLVAIQSFCLYTAVTKIPVALALLVFQLFPLLFVLLSWLTGKEHPRWSSLAPVPLAVVGLALALDVYGKAGDFAGRWAEIGAGVGWAFGAAVAFALVVFFNTHWLKALDGRVRTFYMMSVTAVLTLAGGAAAGSLALPGDPGGWVALALLTLLYGAAITSLFVVLPRLGGGAASTIALNFEPIAALGIAWVALGQAIAPLQVLGAFAVVGAIAWLGAIRR